MNESALERWHEEQASSWVYRIVADAEPDIDHATLFRALARASDDQSEIIARDIPASDGPPVFRPTLRLRVVALLVRILGPKRCRPLLAAVKVRGLSVYDPHLLINGHVMPKNVSEVGGRHHGIAGGNLRAAVFGVNDGLVSNACLILGVSGAAPDASAVVLAAPGMIVGRPVTVAHPDTGRTWHTTLNGLEDVSTPLGKFERCLVITLEMQGPDFSSRATHYFAPRAGLVAYKYHLRDSHDGRALLDIDAVLKLARLAGTNIASLSDLDAIRDASLPAGEDRDVRELLRRALMKRYTWDAQFPGFRGSWELAEPGRAPVAGEFVVTANLTVTVEAPDDAARATMRNEISSFITQRKEVPFDTAYAETTFARSATRPDGTVVVIATNDPLATTYTIKGDELVEVSRSVGRLSYTARDRQKMSTEDGRTLTVDYDVVYTSNQNHAQVAVEHMQDTYAKLGSYWVPTGRKIERTEAGRPPTRREIALTALRSGS